MSRKQGKIVIPSDDEVQAYGQGEQPKPADDAANPAAAEDAGGASAAGAADHAGGADGPAGGEPASESAQEWKDRYLRARAELANYQKRAEKERIDTVRYASAGLVRALLPTLDDLERVIEHAETHKDNAEAILKGVKLVLDGLMKALAEQKVERIAAAGEPFDPALHEAMMEQPSEHAERVVLQVLAKGYRLHERVLRAAKVIVSKPAERGESGAS